MKTETEWFDEIDDCPDSKEEFAPISKQMIRRIQADAFLHVADTQLLKARHIGDALAAALMGEYSRADALGQWAADKQDLVDRLRAEGFPVEQWQRLNGTVCRTPR